MQLTTLLLAALSAISVQASPSWVGGDQVTIQDEFKVPGDNPLYFCGDPKDDLVKIDSVDLDPNPPTAGSKLSIKASGTVNETIEKGFKMHLQVKYGLITLINQEADGCDTIGKADLKCPLKKGDMSMTKDVDLPAQIPPGTYTVLADVYTEDKKKITCLTAKITFHSGGGDHEDKPKENVLKVGKPRFKVSGPMADMVQARMRQRQRERNEL